MDPPVLGALKMLSIPVVVTVCPVEIGFLQELLMTAPSAPGQCPACLGRWVTIPIAH